MISREIIDPLMWDLILALNSAGFITRACCQGIRSWEDVRKERHCQNAYVAFVKSLPDDIILAVKSLGLNVYGQDFAVSAGPIDVPIETAIKNNKVFADKMYGIFVLRSCTKEDDR